VVLPTKHRPRMDRSDRSSAWARLRPRRLHAQRAVRALRVVVGGVLGEDGAQVPLVQREQMVQALPAQAVWFTYIGAPR
jgi:hypothetical protein